MTDTTTFSTDFSTNLYTRLASLDAGNLICSPYSVLVALAMLVQGARGDTAAEILGAVGAREAGELAAGIGAMERALGERVEIELSSASSLWGQAGVRWEPPFLAALEREFGAGLHEVDYGRAEAARRLINGWASERTHERIPEILPAGFLTPASRLTLVNAIYFKGAWRTPFEEHATRPGLFHRLGGSTARVPMMAVEATAGYAEGPGWVAADLAYRGSELAMAVVVPDSLPALEEQLTGAWLSGLLTSFEDERVGVRLPRWTTRSQIDLGGPLAALGIRTAFSGSADFRGLTTQEPVYVSGARHEGFVAVDEAGTEAAAVTAFTARAAGMPRPPAHTVVADRPFLFVIHDRPTGTPLFLGRVVEP